MPWLRKDSRLESQSSKRDSGFEFRCGQEFFILKFSLSSRGSQLESANTNEINCDIHISYILFLAQEWYVFVSSV